MLGEGEGVDGTPSHAMTEQWVEVQYQIVTP
jgi:hypothetical protein